ncbi:diguanylate cyclase domain-containing protein [Massilia sp. DWR3-1-1]|uniref:diguanylate cyclase domain-containing protein n=1 Tax=Massilia sp. DWR3-1-1 TaxID=2804559 RepID=UPI003CE876D1
MSHPIRHAPGCDCPPDLAASVFYHSRDGIMITSLDGNILAVNQAFTTITGYRADEVVGRNPRLLKSGRQGPQFYRAMWDAIVRDGHWQGEAWNRRKDGSDFAERITIATVPDSAGQPHHYIAVFADITSATEERRLLEQQSNFDALTGLPNRLLLQQRLTRALGRARGAGRQVALAFLDLDGFKEVNDRFGHVAGDNLLVTMAQRLQKALRESDTLARFGGDEFVAVLPDLQDDKLLDSLIGRLLLAARTPFALENRQVQLSASVGVAIFPRDGITPDQLIRKADDAMYAAKRSGRNCVRSWPDAVQPNDTAGTAGTATAAAPADNH